MEKKIKLSRMQLKVLHCLGGGEPRPLAKLHATSGRPLWRRLEGEGLIRSWLELGADGRSHRMAQITEAGQEWLQGKR